MEKQENKSENKIIGTGGLYIHIPYCRKRCIYCDFYSAGVIQADWSRLTDSLITELSVRIEELPAVTETLYMGGGTPSLLPAREFARLTAGLYSHIRASEIKEFTIEVNPEDVTADSVALWRDCGVNRVSVGVQSFDDRLLRMTGRFHDGATSRKALELLRSVFDNVSGDLIFGLPGQSVMSFGNDVRAMLDAGVNHLSGYSLMYEECTALTKLRDMGRLDEADETDSVEMFRILCRLTESYGLRRYELSNYALPGYESRHNGLYWCGKPYLGLGPSAHSYDGIRTRSRNAADVRKYLMVYGKEMLLTDPESIPVSREVLTDEELREEQIMTRLRTAEGLDCNNYRFRWGEKAFKQLEDKAARHIKAGNLSRTGDIITLTEKGVMISDEVIVDLF